MTQAVFDKVEKVWGPGPEKAQATRQLIVKVVRDHWQQTRQPMPLAAVVKDTYKAIETLRAYNEWAFPDWTPGYLSIRRRANECQGNAKPASAKNQERFWGGEPTPLMVGGKEGTYQPNPERFPELYAEEGVGPPR